MDLALLLARLLLVLVFFVAGLGKLADPVGSREAVTAFGVPAVLARPSGFLLPVMEIAVAIALLLAGGVRWGALGALALLVLFIAGIGYNLALGRRPDCHCFGQLHSAPVGPQTLVRNGVLAAVAVFVLVEEQRHPGPSAFAWLGPMTTAERLTLLAGIVLLALILVQTWFTLHLLRQNGRLITRLEAVEAQLGIDGAALVDDRAGLYTGAPAPGFSLPSLDDGLVTLSALCERGLPVMLIFSHPDCGPCAQLMPEIGNWQRDHREKLTIALVSQGTDGENRLKAPEHGPRTILLERDSEVSKEYRISGTPSAVVVTKDGTVGSRLALGANRIRTLLERTVDGAPPVQLLAQVARPLSDADRNSGHAPPPVSGVGEPAPQV